ncbi:branched-chain amino acid ABC transporter permease [Thermodesulfobacteriota bacterium]
MNRKTVQRTLVAITILALLFALPALSPNLYWLSNWIYLAINVLMVASLYMISSIGHYSMGHVGFMLIGAYTSALLGINLGLSFWVTLIMAGLLPAIFASVLAYPFLKVKGVYFAILTLVTGETFRVLAYEWKSLTGGPLGLINILPPSPIHIPWLGTISFDTMRNYYYLTIIIVLISLFILFRLKNSELGFGWLSIKSNEVLAESVGMPTTGLKIVNFIIACFFAGIAGALYAHFQLSLSADFSSRFGAVSSMYLILYMVVGGEGRFSGPIIGTIALSLINEFARPLQEYRTILIGAIAILTILFMPEGMISFLDRIKVWVRVPFRNDFRIKDNTGS